MGFEMRKFALIGLSLCAATALTACETTQKAESRIEAHDSESEALAVRAQAPQPARPADTITVNEGVWLGKRSFRAVHGDPLPSDIGNVTLVTVEPMDLRGIAREITNLTQIPVVIERPAVNQQNQGAEDGEDGGDDDATAVPSAAAIAAEQAAGQTDGLRASTRQELTINHTEGSLFDLLNKVATSYGIAWAYEEGALRFFDTETRVYSIAALPGQTTVTGEFEADAGNPSGGAGGGGTETQSLTANQESEIEIEFNFWDDIEDTLSGMLPEGSTFQTAPGSGTITVSAPPYSHRRVENYVNVLNERLSRQVTITIKLLNLDFTERDNYGLNFEAALDGKDLTIDSATALGGGLFTGIVDLEDGNDSLNATIDALSAITRVTEEASSSVTTMNGRPVPLNIVNQENFVSSVTREEGTNEGEGDEVSFETSTLTTGLSMNFLPKIMSDGRVILNYSLSRSRRVALETFPAGAGPEDNQVQLPETTVRSTMQQVLIESGATLVMTGFANDRNTRTDEGTLAPGNWLFGGGKEGLVEEDRLVLLVTPRVHRDIMAHAPQGRR